MGSRRPLQWANQKMPSLVSPRQRKSEPRRGSARSAVTPGLGADSDGFADHRQHA